jgi:hypothetical protein
MRKHLTLRSYRYAQIAFLVWHELTIATSQDTTDTTPTASYSKIHCEFCPRSVFMVCVWFFDSDYFPEHHWQAVDCNGGVVCYLWRKRGLLPPRAWRRVVRYIYLPAYRRNVLVPSRPITSCALKGGNSRFLRAVSKCLQLNSVTFQETVGFTILPIRSSKLRYVLNP